DDQRLDAICFSIVGQCLHYKIGRNIGQRLLGPERFSAMTLDYLADHIARFTLAAVGAGPTLKDEVGPTGSDFEAFDDALSLVPGDPA
ncbi:MAG TPA: CerR family C-terminal domain-containing protein, partial [Isosphaeraceae bacterium]|nr:CerR family C-terminal domain-containing protein [Isosphaeraceae bacterium]